MTSSFIDERQVALQIGQLRFGIRSWAISERRNLRLKLSHWNRGIIFEGDWPKEISWTFDDRDRRVDDVLRLIRMGLQLYDLHLGKAFGNVIALDQRSAGDQVRFHVGQALLELRHPRSGSADHIVLQHIRRKGAVPLEIDVSQVVVRRFCISRPRPDSRVAGKRDRHSTRYRRLEEG